MGEWDAPHLINQDQLIMSHIDMCNIACGGHAGSAQIMAQTIELAIAEDVFVGAHPGYSDRVNFGRSYIDLSDIDLKDTLQSQIDLFLNVIDTFEINPYHIKPHGALYHACNQMEKEMSVLINLMKEQYSYLKLIVFPNSILHQTALKEGLDIMVESFIDRSYTLNLNLASRNMHGSVITSVVQANAQYQNLSNESVITQDGITAQLVSQTACIHGDNPNVLEILESIHS
ncbi:MAG: UPF0271 protein [Saprospiraceae bacterium]|jgi:UPF0271 protein|tara:strand:- start:2601 stop:3290 length:690 start_codon:yes stop_codon:yes gene_type:complete